MEEKIFAEKPEEKISITAEEVTDIRLTQAGYYWEAGYNEFDFTCRIEGTEDRIHMVQQRHDEGYGLVIRSEKDDIWDRISGSEAFRLEEKLLDEVQYRTYHDRIEKLTSLSNCREMQYELMENDNHTNKKETCIKDINIVDIDALSMRSKNILRRNGIFKLSDLTNFLEQHELRDISGLGSSCEDEIEAALKIEIANDSNAETFSAKIEEVYLENKYFLFVNYCHSKGIEYMSDLEGFNFSDLSGVRGIGKGKIEDIISRYEQYDSGNFGNNIESDKREKKIEKTIFNFINEQLEDIDIDFLTGLGIKLKVLSMLISNGYKKLGDIEGISTKTLLHIVGDRNFVKFEGIEDELKKPLFEIFDDVLFAQSKEEDFCIDIKRACGYTLQELGNEYGLTRERIRQKIAKFNSNLDSFMKPIVALFMSPKNYITVQELLDIYDNDDYDKAILYWCKNSDDLEYLEFAEVFVYAQEERNAVENQIETIAEEFIGDGINLYDNLEELEDLMQNSGFPYMDGSSFINLIQQHGYKVYGDFVVKGRQSYGYLCARVVAEKFPNGIKIYDGYDLDKLRTYAAEEYTDLIISFLKNMGMKEVSENNMLTLLVMNNLTYKMIPKELYVSDKLKYINEKFLLPE